MELRLEPLPEEPTPPPGLPKRAPRAPRRLPAATAPEAPHEVHVRRIRRWTRPLLWSVVAHLAIFGLFALIWISTPAPEPEPPFVTIEWRDFSDLQGPEAAPGGRDTKTESPAADPVREAKGKGDGLTLADEVLDTTLGTAGVPAGELFAGRRGGKESALLQGGGDAATEGALRAALDWLARHQSPDGTWSGAGFDHTCVGGKCGGVAERPYVEGATGLALLAFLGAGHTHLDGEWKDTVRRGLDALVRLQKADGLWANDAKRAYASGIASLAVTEAYGMTRSKILRASAERAVAAWTKTQSRTGGWRYEASAGDADSSITAWVAMALRSAERAGIDVDRRVLDGCRGWFGSMRDATGGVGYTSRGESSAALLGTGIFIDVMLGGNPASPANTATATLLARRMPRVTLDESDTANEYGAADPSHWYAGSLGAFQAGGPLWDAWQMHLRAALLPSQERSGCARGSWPPLGATGRHGGRVVTTALCAMCLEVYYRYPRAVR